MGIFQQAFCEVWQHIPVVDRRIMLGFWRDAGANLDGRSLSTQRPLIQVVEVWSDVPSTPVCELLGHQIQFQTDFIAQHSSHLSLEIARLMVRVFRYANRQHWKMVVQMLEQPLACWEAGEGAGPDERAYKRKVDQLERDFFHAHKMAVAQQLHAWGIDPGDSTASAQPC
jgi:hypothetical protein